MGPPPTASQPFQQRIPPVPADHEDFQAMTISRIVNNHELLNRFVAARRQQREHLRASVVQNLENALSRLHGSNSSNAQSLIEMMPSEILERTPEGEVCAVCRDPMVQGEEVR